MQSVYQAHAYPNDHDNSNKYLHLETVPDLSGEENFNSEDEICVAPRSYLTRSPTSTSQAQSKPKDKNSTTESTNHIAHSTDQQPSASTKNFNVSHRGRKRSLVDDLSKAFVCTLCNRRFRRKEHLKRHYQSLHTLEKPFRCCYCSTKFSRSDNLSQHQRTHSASTVAAGAIIRPERLRCSRDLLN